MARDEELEPLAPEDLYIFGAEHEADPTLIAARLVEECDEFEELRLGQPVILFMMSMDGVKVRGEAAAASMALPRFSGAAGHLGPWLLIKAVGALPDYIMTFDVQWWEAAEPIKREALVHHELSHATISKDRDGEPRFTDEGKPMWGIAPHSLEDFAATARRYGAWETNVAAYGAALQHGIAHGRR